MAKSQRLFALVLAFCLLSGLSAEVVLTDEQAAELDQTLDQLETTLTGQSEKIKLLEKQNEQLQNDSENKQKQLDEQDKTIKTLSSSYRKQSLFWVLRSVLAAIASCCLGVLIGIFI